MSDARQRWSERLDRFRRSGQTVTAFCADEGISTSRFHFWKSKLDARVQHSEPLVPIQITSPTDPLQTLELVFPSGTILRLPTNYSTQDLVAILANLEAHSC